MNSEGKLCVVTGAHGYVGSRLSGFLQRAGWRVGAWTRQPEPGKPEVSFRLGQEVDPGSLAGARALVHCAYDFGPRNWPEIVAVNVAGSEKLLCAARKGGVAEVVLISSISAFDGCRSLYGKAKLEIEAVAQGQGAHVIRPGLVYSGHPGGMFGRLVQQVRGSRIIPVLWGGRQVQYLVNDEDLGRVVQACLDRRVPRAMGPMTIAHEQGWELKEILLQIGRALGRGVTFAPVPWQAVWLALKTLELAGLRPNFRSDSLVSMVYQDPHPAFTPLKSLGLECRPFRLEPGTLA